MIGEMSAIETHRRSALFMDTLVSLQVRTCAPVEAIEAPVVRAFGWFAEIERICSRFEPDSEVMRLTTQIGVPVPVSPILYTLVEFALAVAQASEGAFDPTVGHLLERRGFNRNYRTGQAIETVIAPDRTPTYADVLLDPAARTITLRAPLILDLSAVAKGFAIDLAARELSAFTDYAVEAGGDLALRGRNAEGEPWHVGIRHPLHADELIARLAVSDAAVCTSGGYERPDPTITGEHHLVDPRIGHSPAAVASVTVIAPTAMVADALSTAAFVLGPRRGIRFLAEQGVDGLIVTPTFEQFMTDGFSRYLV